MNVRKLLLTLAAVLGLGVAGAVPAIAQVSDGGNNDGCQAGFLVITEGEFEDNFTNGSEDDSLLGLGSDEVGSEDDDEDGLLGLGILDLFGDDEESENSFEGQQADGSAEERVVVCVDDLEGDAEFEADARFDGDREEDDDEGLLGLGIF